MSVQDPGRSLQEAPRYRQLGAFILQQIRDGKMHAGDRLPGEHELCHKFGVSRTTVRKALDDLAAEGWIERHQGRGTYVAERRVYQTIGRLSSFSEDMRERGIRASSCALAWEVEAADKQMAARLKVALGAEICVLERVRLADGLPVCIQIAYLPGERFPGLANRDLEGGSLYRLLEGAYGVVPVAAWQSVEAVAATRQQATLLGVRVGTPLLAFERLSLDAEQRPIEYVRSFYRSDRYRFWIRTGDQGDGVNPLATAIEVQSQ